MKKTNVFAALGLFFSLTVAPLSQAALVSTTLEDVSILGKVYDVSFWADDSNNFSQQQTFAKLSKNGNALAFTTVADATAAIQAIITKAPGFDFNPGGYSAESFRVAYRADKKDYSYLTSIAGAIYGPFEDYSTKGGNLFSLATFSEVTRPSEVPVPAAAWLFGSVALGGFGLQRRKKKA